MDSIEDQGTLACFHAALARVYIAVGRLFLEIPAAELLRSAEAELACIIELPNPLPELTACVGRLRRAMSESDSLADIRADYAGLFAGIRRLPAPPWESCYLSGKRQVCTRITQSVRKAYLKACLVQEASDAQPEDHIGLELQFLGVMHARIAAALDAGDMNLAAEMCSQRADFVAEHLSRWAHAFSADLESAAETEFCRSLAQLTDCLTGLESKSGPGALMASADQINSNRQVQ